jgi:hypothetical protein
MANDTMADIIAEMSGKQTERQLREAKEAQKTASRKPRLRKTSSPGATPPSCLMSGMRGIGSGKRNTSAP